VNPHDFSRFCRDEDEAFSFLLFSQRVDDIQSNLRNWDQSILDSHLRECAKIKSHHVGGDFFLFRLESQNSSIYQSLDLVIEDIAPTGRVMYHPMKEAIIWIICTPHFIRSPSFR